MKKLILLAQVLLVSVLVTSCSEDYLDVNTDPNNPTAGLVTPDLRLPVAQVYTANVIYSAGYMNPLGNLFMPNWAQADGYSWYPDEFQYLITPSFYSTIWDYSYANVLKQYETLQDLDPMYEKYRIISTIMQVYHYQKLVDAYGSIPYFEALQRAANPTPQFDDPIVVYEDLVVQLEEAMAAIDAAEGNGELDDPGLADVIFGGDMSMWKKFANTLKLKILVRQTEMTGRDAYLATEFAELQSGGVGFINTNVGVNPGYVNQEGKQNPYWRDYGLTVAGDPLNNYLATAATEYIINWLEDAQDPRLNYIYERPLTGHLGIPQGLIDYPGDEYEAEFVSNIGPGVLKSPSMDAVIMLASESYFLQAEAVVRGLLTGNAEELYMSGIEASFDYLEDIQGYEEELFAIGIADDETIEEYLGMTVEDYLGDLNFEDYYSFSVQNNQDNVAFPNAGSEEEKLEAILTQKWIALTNINGFEIWLEFNRTGYPAGFPLSIQASQDQLPMRLLYSPLEVSGNPNTPDQADPFNDPIFWAE